MLEIQLKGEEGDTQLISVNCPNGYRTSAETRSVVLRTFSQLDNRLPPKGPEIEYRCLPTERFAALVVRAPGQPDLLIKVYGRELTRTSADGTAHALLRLTPGSGLRVALDTSARPELYPRSPERAFQVEDRDTIFIFDQQFTEVKHPVRHKAPRPLKPIPYRLQ